MRHRFSVGLVGAISTLLFVAWTEDGFSQDEVARVGILSTPLVSGNTHEATVRQNWYAPFRHTLAERGWSEGKNIVFEYRSARGTPPKYAEAAAELVSLKVDVIYADSAPATRAAYAATRSIPIVGLDFTNDPVAAGYAENYGHPGRNLTGFFLDAPEFAAKWLELLKAIIPNLMNIVVLWDPSPGPTHRNALQGAAEAAGFQLQVLEVHRRADLDRAFSLMRLRPQALIILPSPLMYGESVRLAQLTAKHRLPAISMAPSFARSGGMLSYGPNVAEAMERSAILTAKILAGAKPGDLPIERPTRLELVINLRAAKALAVAIPESVLLRADDVVR